MKAVLTRQNYFELIPSRSNRFKSVLGLLVYLEQYPDQTGFFIGIKVFEPGTALSPRSSNTADPSRRCASAEGVRLNKPNDRRAFFRSGAGGQVWLGSLDTGVEARPWIRRWVVVSGHELAPLCLYVVFP